MSRLTLEFDERTHRFRYLLERDAQVVAARQIAVPSARRLLACLAFVLALALMATHPLPYRHCWQPIPTAAGEPVSRLLAELTPSVADPLTLARQPVLAPADGVWPAFATGQPDVVDRSLPTILPTPPDTPALTFFTYEMSGSETFARIAESARVSLSCLAALNDGVDAGPLLRMPPPGYEVVVYRASGGEWLADLAAYWTPEQVVNYLGSGQVGKVVTLAALVNDNALDPAVPLAAGQVVNVLISRPSDEVAVRTKQGVRPVGKTMRIPVAGVLSQGYGGPTGGRHFAIDIAAPLGTPIVCPRDGVVLWVGVEEREWAMGNHLHLVHRWSETVLAYMLREFGVTDYAELTAEQQTLFIAHVQAMRSQGELISMLETVYGHVGALNFGVAVGSVVRTGQALAGVGNNGHSTGPHVHWALLVDEEPQDPLRFVAAYRKSGG